MPLLRDKLWFVELHDKVPKLKQNQSLFVRENKIRAPITYGSSALNYLLHKLSLSLLGQSLKLGALMGRI